MRILRIIVSNRIGRRSARRRRYRGGSSRKHNNRGRGRANRRRWWMDSKTGHKCRGRGGRSMSRRLSKSSGRGRSSRRCRG